VSSSEPVSRLVILRGNFNFSFSEGNYRNFVYSIDREIPSVQNVEVLNDQELLHSCALQIRDEYTKWVYGLNEEFLRSGLIKDDLSLFFLSDFSCKRSEIFDTYNSICNLLVIQEKLRDTYVSEAILVGVDKQFYRAFVSAFPDIKSCLKERKQERAQVFRTLVSNTVYFLELFVVGIYNLLDMRNIRSDRSSGGRYFFSPYPQHLSPEMIGGEDIKYRKFVRPEDKYLASILMDGLHQHVGLGQFIKLKRKLPVARFTLLDNYINPLDVLSGIYWSLRGGIYLLSGQKKKYVFLEIDITAYVKKELRISFGRIARLMVMEKHLRRFFYYNDIDELVYYLFEYPIGRLLSYVVGTSQNRLTRIGFQHGPSSWIKMLHFLAPGESSSSPPFLSCAPVPDRILAEDSPSAEIYRHSGYDNVQMMDSIYRLDYLADVKIDLDQDCALIVPGLHDGQLLLNIMKPFIQEHPTITCYFRPHPRANNSYVSFFDSFVNLYMAYEPIEELLQKVSRVFVTYSSVGVEAKWLGLDVTIVEIPGRLNESPLLDRP
jgi:hypothetical protein